MLRGSRHRLLCMPLRQLLCWQTFCSLGAYILLFRPVTTRPSSAIIALRVCINSPHRGLGVFGSDLPQHGKMMADKRERIFRKLPQRLLPSIRDITLQHCYSFPVGH